MENLAYLDTGYTVLLHVGGALFIYSHMLSHQADADKRKLLKKIAQGKKELELPLERAEEETGEMLKNVHQAVRQEVHDAHIESLKNLYGSQNLEQKLVEAGYRSKSTKFLGLDHVIKRVDSLFRSLKIFLYKDPTIPGMGNDKEGENP